jgi:iron(III) transport system permease protein
MTVTEAPTTTDRGAADPTGGLPGESRFHRLRYRAQVLRREPVVGLSIVLVVVLGYLVIGPLVSVLSDAGRVQLADVGNAKQSVGSLTSYYLWRVFRSPVSAALFWKPLTNTVVVAFGTTLFALIVGGALAWLLVRTDVRGRKWLATALVVPYMLPSWTFSLAWLSLFKNDRAGGQIGFLEGWGVHTPDWLAYGPLPMIICLGLHYYPFVLLLFGNALRRLDAQLEDSARILGARPGTVARRVTIPLMLPALSSAVLLVFGKVLGTFGTPYILGLPTNYMVLSTSLYRSIRNHSAGEAAVFTGVIVIIGIGFLLLDTRLVREQKRFVTVGGKGSMDRVTGLGRWRHPASAIAVLVFVGAVIIPLATLVLSTITKTPGVFNADNFTLQYWLAPHLTGAPGFPHGVLRGSDLYLAAWHSVKIVGTMALCCGLAGILIGYVVVRSDGRIGTLLRQISFLPYLIPGIAFAAASLSLFAIRRGPIPALYGTSLLLIIVLVVTHLPYSSRSGISAMTQLGKEPEEAAQIAGARWFTRITRVVLPIQKGPLVVGVVLPFISGLKELSIVIMLTTTGTQLLTTLSISLVDFAYTQMANAVVLVIAAVAFTSTYLMQKITKTSLAAGLGG